MVNTAIAGVLLIPLIIGLIQFFKKLFPGADGRVWLAVSLVLGVAGQVVAYLIDMGKPTDLAGWTALVVLGLAFGLAASKAYDETIKPPGLI